MYLVLSALTYSSIHLMGGNPKINFIYLGNKEVYCIFETCSIVSVYFSQYEFSFRNLIFFFPNNDIFTKYVRECKYPHQEDKGKLY